MKGIDMEQLPQAGEERVDNMPMIGESVFVRRSDGRVYAMTIAEIEAESYVTFDEYNQPVKDRRVIVRGSSPDMIGGELAYPQKIIPARMTGAEYQKGLQTEMMGSMVAPRCSDRIGRMAAANSISSPVYRIPHAE